VLSTPPFKSLFKINRIYTAMIYPIPASTQEFAQLHQTSLNAPVINEELIASAIAGVIQLARSNGQSLEDLMNEILADDALLDSQQRRWLGRIVSDAWGELPA
jgi:hypothetical protein